MAIRTILVPTDFSAHSEMALERALDLAVPLGAKVVLLHSYWVSVSMTTADFWVMPPEFVDQLRGSASAELDKLTSRIAQSGVECEARLCATPAVAAILETATELPADLIAMGTHGLTGLKHALLGSVAERVVRLAPCPVLTVKLPKEEEKDTDEA
jgi:universal stress protein A